MVNFCEQIKISHPVKEDFFCVLFVEFNAVFLFYGFLKLFDCLLADHTVSVTSKAISLTYALAILNKQKMASSSHWREDINKRNGGDKRNQVLIILYAGFIR